MKSTQSTSFNYQRKLIQRIVGLVTLVMVIFFPSLGNAKVMSAENTRTHLRWSFAAKKGQLYVTKKNNRVVVETLNIRLFDQLVKAIDRPKIDTKYIVKLAADKSKYPKESAKLFIDLKDETVELFSFYKESSGQMVLDFWVNEDKVVRRNAAIAKKKKARPSKKKRAPKKLSAKKTQRKVKTLKKKKQNILASLEKKSKAIARKESQYRDFRYGGALIWDYAPLLPKFAQILDLKNKTPEFFYSVEDVDYNKDEQHSHVQLTINLFRQKKWGLMYKSIKLFEKKYGQAAFQDVMQYLKANALLRSTFRSKDQGIQKSAINMFINITEFTKNYFMRRAIYKYQIQYHLDYGDFVQALMFSKRIYVDSMQNFDEETSIWAAHSILHNLAVLKQFRKIEEFLADKTVKKLLPKQLGIAYLTYVALERGDNERVANIFEDNRKALVDPVHAAIVFNSAEAYFRIGRYSDAVKLFDKFIAENSFMSRSSVARVRIALSYEVMEEDSKKVKELYMNAINRASDNYAKYEARIRYVGMRIARNKKLTEKDLEYRVLLARDEEENKIIDRNILKLLWLVRLRSFISNMELQKAITYLTSLPWHDFKPVEKRTFEADAAEVVYGLIKQNYDKGEYAEAVKIWEIYKSKYITKVAMNPYLNFIVCNSYLKLGLPESFARTLSAFKKLEGSVVRTFPIWIERREIGSVKDMVAELDIIRAMMQKEWTDGLRRLSEIRKKNKNFIKYNYYRALLSYRLGRHKIAKKSFDSIFMESDRVELSKEEIANLVTGYIETLYALDNRKEFLKRAEALLVDVEKSANNFLKLAKERLIYLIIEAYGENKNISLDKTIALIQKFRDNFSKSPYIPRVTYIEAKVYLKRENTSKGEKLLRKILEDENVPNYLKEMARTDLTSIMIKKRSL